MRAVQPVTETATRLSYIVIYPEGTTTVGWVADNPIIKENYDIANEVLDALIMGGGVSIPSGCGWAIGIVDNETGKVNMIGSTE